MRINEIFGYQHQFKPFGRKGTDQEKSSTYYAGSVGDLTPEEREQLKFAREYGSENAFADALNPIHVMNTDPPELHDRFQQHDLALRNRYRKWKKMGLVEASMPVVHAKVFPAIKYGNEIKELVIDFTAKMTYAGNPASLESPAEDAGWDLEINEITFDPPTLGEVPEDLKTMAEEWFELNQDTAMEAVHDQGPEEDDRDY